MSRRFITLGTWEDKPLQWMVLKEESTGTLVISKYELFSVPFYKGTNNNNWEKCSLRKYLNDDFFQTAFSKEEQKRIVNAFLEEPNATKDDVFILSYKEASTLMTPGERKANSYQWTRTPRSDNPGYVLVIDSSGVFYSYYASNNSYVRPAMYIREK